MKTDPKTVEFGAKVMNSRQLRGLTRVQLCEIVGNISENTLFRIEHGLMKRIPERIKDELTYRMGWK